MLTSKTPHLLTVAEYMNSNIPGHTELIGGLVYDVSPKNEPHIFAVTTIAKALIRGLGDEYAVRIQDPIAVDGWNGPHAPEIDVAVVNAKTYTTTPTARDSQAFVEVSDSTYREDRDVKIPLYVKAGVPTWQVNIPGRAVEHYPAAMSFAQIIGEDEDMVILGVRIPVRDLFMAQ